MTDVVSMSPEVAQRVVNNSIPRLCIFDTTHKYCSLDELTRHEDGSLLPHTIAFAGAELCFPRPFGAMGVGPAIVSQHRL